MIEIEVELCLSVSRFSLVQGGWSDGFIPVELAV